MKFTRKALEAEGFRGFLTVRILGEDRIGEVPSTPGLYVVLRELDSPPIFLEHSSAGRFKRKDPTIPLPQLELNWVPDTHLLYVGKADGRNRLRRRINDLLRFGRGIPDAHYGGGSFGKSPGANNSSLPWKETMASEKVRALEGKILRSFRDIHGRLPFANLIL